MKICNIEASLFISVFFANIMVLLLLFLYVGYLTELNFLILSVFIGIISAFATILKMNKFCKVNDNYSIIPEFIISVIVAYFLIYILLFYVDPIVDPEIMGRIKGLFCLIGIISVFASIFLIDKVFPKKQN